MMICIYYYYDLYLLIYSDSMVAQVQLSAYFRKQSDPIFKTGD